MAGVVRLDAEKFRLIADSLRQYRRADLAEFSNNEDALDILYTDPLSNEAVLRTVLAPNTTFIAGRKGTGKSTIFGKAQREIRKEGKSISIYIDVKSLYDASKMGAIVKPDTAQEVDYTAIQTHLVRRNFISFVLKELLEEISLMIESLDVFRKIRGIKRKLGNLKEEIHELQERVNSAPLQEIELPVFHIVNRNQRLRHEKKATTQNKTKGQAKASPKSLEFGISAESSMIDEALRDEDSYRQYTEILLQSFPFMDIIEAITNALTLGGLNRLYIFFDDYSELNWIDQRVFTDVVLAPLNNTSNERIKLKIAAYPGRIYYGSIDPTKTDLVPLDFFELYRSTRLPDIESGAIDYTKRLIKKRFEFYKISFDEYLDDKEDIEDIYFLLFAATSNIPRVLGYVLHYCYLERIAANKHLNKQSIVNSTQKYYRNQLLPYFSLNRYSLEPYEQKLDIHNQQNLLNAFVEKARDVRKQILSGKLTGKLYNKMKNPPTSHFTISKDLESLVSGLELKTFISKYHEMRDKDGNDISVFALNYGLCANERIDWGYPKRQRYDKDWFKQRPFNFNSVLHEFLLKTKTIKCDNCGMAYPMDLEDKFQFYKWRCPECTKGHCKVVNLDSDFRVELEQLEEHTMLEQVELEILNTLHEEDQGMKAGEISALLDVTYQLVGKRTERLYEMEYVDKKRKERLNYITKKARKQYFQEQ